MPDACGTCNASVVFAWTPAGAQAIVDVEPVANGNVLLLRESRFGVIAVTLSKGALERARVVGAPLRLSHWASCPDKAEWRAKQEAKRAAA